MRRSMAAIGLVLGAALLGGCSGSGFGTYVHDTTRLPGRNPNVPAGDSLNHLRVMAQAPAASGAHAAAPVSFAENDSWPGPPKAIPSLQDLQRQQNEALASGNFTPHPMGGDLPHLPGYEVTPPEAPAAAPQASFPAGVVKGDGGGTLGTLSNPETRAVPPPDRRGNIVVPNGDGSSTVIAPDGSVTTVPAPGKN